MDKTHVAVPLTATLAVHALASLASVTVPILAPTAARDVGIAATSVGVYVGLIYVAGMVSGLWSGDFIGRYGAVRISQACLLLCGIGLMLAAAASLPVLILSALVIGLGYGAVTPASSHILSRTTPVNLRSFVFSVKQTGVPLGGAAAGAIVPTLVVLMGWKNAAAILGAVCALGAILAQPIRARFDGDRHPLRPISLRGATEPLKLVLTHRPLLRLALISFCYGAMQLCLITYLVIYLTRDVEMALIGAGLILSAAQLAGSAGRIMWGLIADRLLRPPLVLGLIGITMSLGAVATACFSPAWSYPAICGVVMVFGASAIGWNGVYLAEAVRLAPEGQVGAATGGCLFFTFLGVVAGPPVFAGLAMLTDSYAFGFLLFAGCAFVSALVAISGGLKKIP